MALLGCAPVPIDLSPSITQDICPSSIFTCGTRSFHFAGARLTHMSCGSARWVSASMILSVFIRNSFSPPPGELACRCHCALWLHEPTPTVFDRSIMSAQTAAKLASKAANVPFPAHSMLHRCSSFWEKRVDGIELANRYFASIKDQDLDGLIAFFAEDATMNLPDGREFRGVAAIRAMYHSLFAAQSPSPRPVTAVARALALAPQV